MHGNLAYMTSKSNFKQVNEHIPPTETIPHADDPATFETRKKELATDLLKKAKQLEILIDNLPSANQADAQFESHYQSLQTELAAARAEYNEVLQTAGKAISVFFINPSPPNSIYDNVD